jgi:hypothetical protein
MAMKKFDVRILKRGNYYITVTEGGGRRGVKYVPSKRIPTNIAIGSIVGQLVKKRLEEYGGD